MGYSIRQIITRFAKNNSLTSLSSRNVYIEGDTLFSYGSHFPMMIRMEHWRKWRTNHSGPGLLLNADVYSASTSRHQSECAKYATIQIPFSALQNILYQEYTRNNKEVIQQPITYSQMCSGEIWMQELNLIDHDKQRYDIKAYQRGNPEYMGLNCGHKKYIQISPKKYNAMPEGEEKHQYSEINERRPESCVLEFKGKYYLSSMDRNQYFIVELPSPVEFVHEAFQSILPIHFQQHDLIENQDYIRQGEWFMIDITKHIEFGNITKAAKKRQYDSLSKHFILPRLNEKSNKHVATRGGFISDFALKEMPKILKINADTCVISGRLEHPQHSTTKLSTLKDIRFFACFKNQAVQNWSTSGNVD